MRCYNLPVVMCKELLIIAAGETGAERTREDSKPAQKNKSSEVVLGPFVSASSSLLDPCLTCYAASLAGCHVRSSLGLRAYRQPEKPTQRLGTLSCLRRFFLFSSTSALL